MFFDCAWAVRETHAGLHLPEPLGVAHSARSLGDGEMKWPESHCFQLWLHDIAHRGADVKIQDGRGVWHRAILNRALATDSAARGLSYF